MVDIRTRKDLLDLKFYLWRIRDERRGEWRKEVYLMGDDRTLETLIESLQGLQDAIIDTEAGRGRTSAIHRETSIM